MLCITTRCTGHILAYPFKQNLLSGEISCIQVLSLANGTYELSMDVNEPQL